MRQDGELRAPLRKHRTLTLQRGGRFGVTIRSRRTFEDTWDQLAMAVIGAVIVLIGYEVSGGWGVFLFAAGMLLTGIGLERTRLYYSGEIVEAEE